MKILLVSPCIDPDYKTPRRVMIPQLSLHLLAGLTPPRHTVTIAEEEYEDIPFDSDCDLVGISCFTANAPRGYALADRFRAEGKTVVMGGIHPTLLPEEALTHADAVVSGEAEGAWETLLNDFEKGRLKKIYHHRGTDLSRHAATSTQSSKSRGPFRIVPIMTTRGCPYDCEFCSVSKIYGKTIRHIPVERVVRDIAKAGGRGFIFHDDNIIGDPDYARELFTALKSLKIKWGGQAPVALAHNPELLKLAAESGCVALLFGLESISAPTLRRFRKSIKEPADIERAIRVIRDHGILFHASLVFGFDEHTKSIFPETLDFLERNKITTASFNILTPYPGTRTFKKLMSEGRIITTDWRYYDTETVVFKPKNMSPLDLHEGKLWIKKEFFRTSSIARRLTRNLDHPILYTAVNLGLRESAYHEIARFPGKAQELFGNAGTSDDFFHGELEKGFDGYDRLRGDIRRRGDRGGMIDTDRLKN